MRTTTQNAVSFYVISFLCIFYPLALFCYAADILTEGQIIRDGETRISAGGEFELGFFSPINSTWRYVGIWYPKIWPQSVVWVANREKPISDRNGVLTIGSDGNLMVFDGNGSFIWSSNASVSSNKTAAILLYNGNLVLSSSDDVGDISKDISKAFWQSFTNPTDTYLPGMNLAVKVGNRTGENRVFNSWKSANDPSPGIYSMGIDSRGSPQIVIWEGERRRWRSGHWNSIIFTGVPNMSDSNYLHGFKFFPSDGGVYFTYVPPNISDVLRFRIKWDGMEELLNWDRIQNKWRVEQSQPANTGCDLYNMCGNFGVCNMKDSPICRCMEGFEPKEVGEWSRGNWSGGCVRRTKLQYCGSHNQIENGRGGDGFAEVKCVKLPDMVGSVWEAEEEEGCKDKCLKNCSCNAYANVNGIGCMMWSGELVDIKHLQTVGETSCPIPMTLHIRLAASEFGEKPIMSRVVIATVVAVGAILVSIFIWLLWKFIARWACSGSFYKNREYSLGPNNLSEVSQLNGLELRSFTFSEIARATNNFSEENVLGRGGFGPVYKGKLLGGQEVAVKRLSSMSKQGSQEFENELKLIAKLQHRNLVKLLGCSIQGEEKMLLYEFMPNKSLDYFLFDSVKKLELTWIKRFQIIKGTARGLLYLHRDSRLKIIHRDMKASNVLLDKDMNPKISDFGIAKIFDGNQNETNTERIIGTRGYISPEYLMEGLVSEKSDIYSFGVLLLEIISGQKCTDLHFPGDAGLIESARNLWNSENARELIDPSIAEEESYCESEVVRCIHIGMLCVQNSAVYRPPMSSVVSMLEHEASTLQLPNLSTFPPMEIEDTEFYHEGNDFMSSNEITVLVGR